MRGIIPVTISWIALVASGEARGDAAAPSGTPPPEAKALVAPPAAAPAAPSVMAEARETTATASAGGQWATGNSQALAGTVNAKLDLRRGADGFGASLLGNYAQGAAAGQSVQETAENVQGRLRYDRYLLESLSVFLIGTVRHDKFQGLDERFNLDPGVKYLFLNSEKTKLWGELGYDLQYDIRSSQGREQLDTAVLLDHTFTDHSTRLYFGFRHAFNKEVTFSTGLEYLQSLVDSTGYRINYDALLAAELGAGFSFGAGFTARYDHHPLPTKVDTDTATTFSLIYAYSDIPKPPPPPPPPCLCPPPPPPPLPPTAPAAAPPPAAAPATLGATPASPPPTPTNPSPPVPTTPAAPQL